MFCIVLAYSYLCTVKQLLSIFVLLVALCCCTTEADRNRMRSGLDSINERNRNDQPFTVQDVEPYVQFFDDEGTPNDRLLAHYLLGRAYHEAGEAPMALECYQKAAEFADTTSKDCDYRQMSRVYAQMAEVFYYQGLYRLQLNSEKLSVKYAWLGGDTLAALMSYEQESFAYRELGKVDSAILVIENVAKEFAHYGYPSDEAIAFGGILSNLIDKGEYAKTKRYMNIYESESGLFDESGDISKGREVYYYYRGLLCLKEQNLDSAEYWFRKELNYGRDLYNQNGGTHGLSMVFEQKQEPDSFAKYSALAYSLNDSVYRQMATDKIIKMQSLYDYTRNQQLAHRESQRANRIAYLFKWSVSLFIIIGLVVYIVISNIVRKRNDAIQSYKNSLIQIERAQYDIARLQSQNTTNASLICEKERIIEVQQHVIRKYQQNKVKEDNLLLEKKLKESDEYKNFLNYSNKALIPSEQDWQLVHIKLFELFPHFHDLLISKKHLLNQNEFNSCFLMRMHFKPADLMNMLEISSSYSTKIRKSLLKKLFNIEGKAEDFDEKIASVF